MTSARPPHLAALARGDEPLQLSLTGMETDLGGGEVMDGNVLKAVLVSPGGERFFVKRYHERTSPRDAVYELIGQRVAARAGLPAATTFLGKESSLYVLSRDFLAPGERLVTLRALKLESRFPARVIEFLTQELGARDFAVDVLLLDALLNNRGRHTGNLAIVTDASGSYLRPAPLFDTVAFDNTRLWEAAKNGRPRWLSPGANPDLSHTEMVTVLREYVSVERRVNAVTAMAVAAEQTLETVSAAGLITPFERELMATVLTQSASILCS